MNAARSSGWRSSSAEASAGKVAGRLDWERDGRGWPNRDCSEFVPVRGIRWHVQRMGQGPTLLLAHGAGAATHSWRDLAPLLSAHFSVVAMDLPGHGFTSVPPESGYSLPGMASALAELLSAIEVKPDFAVGHSAGAAILARMCLDRTIAPRELVSLNGAFLPFRGALGQLFAPLAKVLAGFSAAPRFFAWNANDPAVVDRLLRRTGSSIDSDGVALYRLLARNPGHLGAVLKMMANWDLAALLRDLPGLSTPLTLVVGSRDGTVSPGEAHRVRVVAPSATVHALPGLGHLAHEERPAELASLLVRRWLQRTTA